MKRAEELKGLWDAIGKAAYAYYRAVERDLKKTGVEYRVEGDEDSDVVRLTVINGNGDGISVLDIDKVRWNKKTDTAEVHICGYNYQESDDWTCATILGDDMDYVYNAIKW